MLIQKPSKQMSQYNTNKKEHGDEQIIISMANMILSNKYK